MRVLILGPLEVAVAGTTVRLSGARQRKLVAALALDANRTVPVSRLVDVLWDVDPPVTAGKQVRNLAGMVRRAFAADADSLATDADGYRLRLPDNQLDAVEFERGAAAAWSLAEGGDRAAAVATARSALALWRGPMLSDLACPALAAAIAGWEERRLTLLEQCLGWELDLGGHERVLAELRELTLRFPTRERLVEHLMLALYRNGGQAESLRVFHRTRGILVDELGVDPGPRLRELQHAVLTHDPVLAGPRRSWRGPRSHLSVLVGRDGERAEVATLLGQGRLLTIVGVGGVGKSSLALTAAEDVAADFADGVVVVTLAEVRRPDEVVLAVGAVLGLVGASLDEVVQEIGRRLAGRQVLLLLDNCEHVAGACAHAVRHLLPSTTKVLATSRRPLGLAEERVWGLAGLSGADAAELFGRRAREAVPGVSLDAGDVARICRRLDGLPLALELAAARLRTLPVTELADRLEDGLSLLSAGRCGADPRHHTLAAAIEWSYRLLEPEEQLLLARLAVFVGGFTAEGAEAVCHAPPLRRAQVLPTLAALVDQSLVQTDPDRRRYRLLEAVRDYATDRLAELGETTAMADRHLDHRLAQLRDIDTAPTLVEVARAGAALPAETENLRAVLEHGFAGGRAVEATELATLAFVHWTTQNRHHTEGGRWLAAAAPYLRRCPPRVRRNAELEAAVLRMNGCDWLAAKDMFRALAARPDELDPRMHGVTVTWLTISEVRTLNPCALATAHAFFTAANRHDAGTALGADTRGLALYCHAYAQVTWGRYDAAAALYAGDAESVATSGHANAIRNHVVRSLAAYGRGDHTEGRRFADKARELFAERGPLLHGSMLHRALVPAALCEGDARPAAEAAVAGLAALYPPSMTWSAEFKVALGEAYRRAGAHGPARTLLAEGMRDGRQDYAGTLAGVVSTALLALDVGDRAFGAELSSGWERTRRGLGLPAPLGYAGLVEDRLGLDPAGSRPTCPWAEQPLRDLIEQATAWCVRRGIVR